MHRDLLRHLTFLAIVRVLVLACTPQPPPYLNPPAAACCNYGSHSLQRDHHLLRDVHICRPARPRSNPAAVPPGRPPPALTRDVTSPEAPPGRSPTAGDRAGPRQLRGRGRRPQRRGARGRRGRRCSGRRKQLGNLHVGSLNIQSLKPKLLELSNEVRRRDLDVLFLSETWLRPATPSRLIVVPGYTLCRSDRPDGRGYGGVAILYKTGITMSSLKISNSGNPDSKLESQWALLRLDRGRQLVIGSLYRPPRHTVAALQDDFADLETQLQRVLIDLPGVPLVLCGDLNCDWLKDHSDPARRRFAEFLSDHSLHQLVASSTFTSGSLLDVCVVNNRDIVRSLSVFHCDFSPHSLISVRLNVPKPRVKPIVISSRDLKHIDLAAFNFDLGCVNWGEVFTAPTVSDQWNIFLTRFLPIVDIHAPLRKVTIRNPTAPPVSDATRDMMSRRRAALAHSGRDSAEYRELNRAVRSAVRHDRRHDIQREISERGPSSVWRCIRTVVAGKGDAGSVRPDASADQLNEFFVSVGPRVAAEIGERGPPPITETRLPRVGACSFSLSPVTREMLGHTVLGMRSSAACGADGVCIRMLRAGFPAIGDVILHIVNSCLIQSDIPDPWKHSIIHPIFKSGNSSDPSNFRPISLVPVITKIVERLVHRQLYNYLSYNHLLSPSQHGFRPHHSTETALLSVSDHILAATDRGEVSLLCLIDLSKCFDVIDHEILLTKLMLHGIETSWFAAYLQGHTQSVSLNDGSRCRVLSRPLANNMGIFQGSVLGPLLFTIFSNDLALHSDGALVFQYADDTQVLVSGPKGDPRGLASRMEAALFSLNNWFLSNKLKVNASKTQLITFGSRQNLRALPQVSVDFCGVSLRPQTEVGNLGVIFDSALSWESHVSELCRRCMGVLIGLSHCRHYLPDGVTKTLVIALVLSRINYCLTVYGNGTKKNFDRIQKVLNFSARIIFGRRKFDRVADLRERLRFMTPRQMTEARTLALTHKVLRRGEPDSLADLFVQCRDTRDRSTRQDGLLRLPRPRTEAGRRRFAYRAPALYNSLPAGVTDMSYPCFIRAVRERLLSADVAGRH